MKKRNPVHEASTRQLVPIRCWKHGEVSEPCATCDCLPEGRRRYLRWPEREAIRQKVLEEQAAALAEASARHNLEPTTPLPPERSDGYPPPRRRKR